jgi:hypothetical protein
MDFGVNALQKYAEIIEDGNEALLFQNVRIKFRCSIKCICYT